MIQLKSVICICAIATALWPSGGTYAENYYVSLTGSDSNPGTSTKPWRTVAYAVASMVAGDTTYVRGGIYKEGIIKFGKSGTQSAPIKLLNAPGESPIVDCIDASKFHRFILERGPRGLTPIGWITIEGFEIRNCHEGIKLHTAHDVTIRRNWIHDNGHGLLGNGTRILIDSNRINHNGQFEDCALNPSECNKDHGIYANGTAIVITNNLIYDNLAFGIQMNGTARYDRSKHAGPEYILSRDWVVANNTFAYQNHAGGMVIWGSSCDNARIENNIFYENAQTKPSRVAQGIHFTSMTCTGITIRNNLAYASGSGGTIFLGSGANEWVHYTQSGNMVNLIDPRFVDAPSIPPPSPNFALTERSPAIDAGLTNAMAKIAFGGVSRPQGRAYDIGAYEYSAGSDTKGPEAPISLQVR